MKLCDVAQFFSPLGGGVKRYLDEKACWISSRPEIEHVVLRPGPRDRTHLDGRTRVYEVASPRLPGSASYRMLIGRRRMLEILAAERPDVLEVDGPYRAAWIALEAGRRLGAPVVGFYHSDFPRSLGRTLERFAGRWSRRLCDPWTERYVVGLYGHMALTLAPSPHVAEALAACGLRRVRTVALGVDTERFRPRPGAAARLREGLGLGDGDRLLLHVGRLAREKRIAALLGAFERLRGDPRLGRCHLLLVGDGEQRDLVRRAARRDYHVTWWPYRESVDELAACYTAADLLVHAGTGETFGLVSIEAQACGTRVVAVRGGGLEGTLAPEAPPVLAADPSPAALARAAVEALVGTDPVGPEGRRRHVVEHFHVEGTFRRLFGLYDELLANGAEERNRPGAIQVRPYRASDRAGVRHLCCETAVGGGPVEPLFPDRDAYADFFTRYYTDFEPESAFVAVADGRVVGYLLASTRPRRFALLHGLLMASVTAPKVLWRLAAGRYDARGRRFLRWLALRSWRETPRHPPRAAHFHFNTLAGHRNTGAALRLWRHFERLLAERGARRVYGQIRTGAGEGWRGDHLFARWGFEPFDRRRVTKLDGLPGGAARGEELYLTTYMRATEPATAPRDPRRPGEKAALVVSLHDVHAESWRTYRPWVDELAALGVAAVSLLVVPRWRGRPLTDDPGMVDWLRGLSHSGHEVVQHGLLHAADQIRGGVVAHLMGRVYTAGEGEFHQLGYDDARRRLEEGRAELAAADLAASGFVAPAWLLSRPARRAAADAGFAYTTSLHGIELLPSGPPLWAPSVVLSLRSRWRKAVSRVYAPAWFRATHGASVLRLAVHPRDLADPEGRALLARLARSAAATRRAVTYRELVRDLADTVEPEHAGPPPA